VIPSTNDPGLNTTGWAYTVTEHINDGRAPFLLQVPYSVNSIDLPTAPNAVNSASLPVLTGIYATDIGVTVAAQSAVVTA
jgi:hypothetical protein